MLPWGNITAIQGPTAVAAAKPDSTSGALMRTADPSRSAKTTQIKQVKFQLPPVCPSSGVLLGPESNCLPQPARPGQTVFLGNVVGGNQVQAGIVKFPIRVPDQSDCVAREWGTNACYWVRTSDVSVSNTGIINGVAQINADAYYSGFQGNVAIRLLDANGNDLVPTLQVGCWGVNERSGRTENFSFQVDPNVAVQTVRVKLYGYSSPCGDKVKAFFDQLGPAADAIGKAVPVIAAIVG